MPSRHLENSPQGRNLAVFPSAASPLIATDLAILLTNWGQARTCGEDTVLLRLQCVREVAGGPERC